MSAVESANSTCTAVCLYMRPFCAQLDPLRNAVNDIITKPFKIAGRVRRAESATSCVLINYYFNAHTTHLPQRFGTLINSPHHRHYYNDSTPLGNLTHRVGVRAHFFHYNLFTKVLVSLV